VRYVDDTELNSEIADFRAVLEAKPAGFVEPFMTAPSPGIIAAAMKNEHYNSEEAYLTAVATAIQVEYEAIVKSGFLEANSKHAIRRLQCTHHPPVAFQH
jgi:5-methyltetrahydropteroyltriglutamate--homocysteine methyltransferase